MPLQTRNSKIIRAPIEKVYHAMTDPRALEIWQVPEHMTAQVHGFMLAPGKGYEMSLHHPPENASNGITGPGEDRFTATFLALKPFSKIVERINFQTSNPDFLGDMVMTIELEPTGMDTDVVISFENIPVGISAADNEAGTNSALNKLARYLESGTPENEK